MIKRNIIIFIGLIALLILGINWFFPYSFFSISKSYTYDQDNIVVDQYLEEMKEFKKYYEQQSKDDLTTDRLQYIVPLYELPWLTTKKPVKMTYQQLELTLFELKGVRQTLLELTYREDYNQTTKDYLKMALEGCLGLEESITSLMNASFDTRKDIRIQIGNLHGGFISNFSNLVTFYKEYKQDR